MTKSKIALTDEQIGKIEDLVLETGYEDMLAVMFDLASSDYAMAQDMYEGYANDQDGKDSIKFYRTLKNALRIAATVAKGE